MFTKGICIMENEKIIKSDGEQISQTNNDAGSVISRHQFSLGVSGIAFAATILESLEHNTLRTLAAKASIVPVRPRPQKLTPHAFNQPQYVLSKTAASIWSPDGRYIATFQENTVTLYNTSM